MIVRRSGIDWWSRRAELLKSFAGQEVLCLTENLYPPDASLRRKLHHHLTSLCLMMLFDLFLQTLRLRTTSEPLRVEVVGRLFSDRQVILVTLALPFILSKITLPDVVVLNFKGIVYIYFCQAVQWAVRRAT